MGHQQSSTKQENSQNIKIGHPRFDKVKTVKNGNNQFLQISIPVVNETQIVQWKNQYNKFLNYQCLLLPREHQFKGTQMCGSNGHCIITYDNFPFLLKEQIADRCLENERKYFETTQIWYLAYTIIESAHAFHGSGRKIGDVRPINIFINDNGQTKVANQLSWPAQYNNYEKALYGKEVTYLAPEQFVELNYGQHEPRGHFEIAEAFSIGLTLLDSATLSDSSDLYNLNTNRFNYQKLQQRLRQLFTNPRLDNNIKHLIAGMCHTQPKARLTCRMLYQWLQKYHEPIVNIEHFQFKDVPSFLFNESFRPADFRQSVTRTTPDKIYVQQPVYMESQVVANSPHTVIFNRPSSHYDQNQTVFIQQGEPRVKAVRQEREERQINATVVRPQNGEEHQNGTRHSYETTQTVVRTGGQVNSSYSPAKRNDEEFRMTLEKIQEQLAMSRKMFPS